MCSGRCMKHKMQTGGENAARARGCCSMADGFPGTLGTLAWLRRFLGKSRNARPETWKAIWWSLQLGAFGDLSI